MQHNKPLKHFTAKHIKTGQVCDFKFYSEAQARYFNPDFVEWREVL